VKLLASGNLVKYCYPYLFYSLAHTKTYSYVMFVMVYIFSFPTQ